MQDDAHVLVVEDEPALRGDLAKYLVTRGFRVDQAASCKESLGVLDKKRPDIILLDLSLPDGSGWSKRGR